jgi:hypothetical protein
MSDHKRLIWPQVKAVLKPPHSRRWRECQTHSNRAKRLECGAFTAAFACAAGARNIEDLRPHESGVALRFPPQSKTML